MPMDVQGLAALLPTEAPPSTTNREAAQQFEAYMVAFLAQQMRASSPEGPMSSGPMATFAGLFDQEIGKRVAERGGLGPEAVLGPQLERARRGADEDGAAGRARDVEAAREHVEQRGLDWSRPDERLRDGAEDGELRREHGASLDEPGVEGDLALELPHDALGSSALDLAARRGGDP